jgi:TolB-like protein/DNA-binding winged helix-turn-helix (wHTH) protein/tetratricopeptide (TPR) repeat protein
MATPARPTQFYDFGPFQLDPANRVLLRHGSVLPLGPKIVETLLILVQRAPQPVSKDELLSAVWPDTFVSENNLTHNISVLRKTLGPNPTDESWIETIPKRGYRFVGTVTSRETLSLSPSASRRWSALGGALALFLAAIYFFLPRPNSVSQIRSVAVLPFLNLTRDSADEPLSDGLTEDLTTALSKVPQLKVPARTSAFQFKGKADDIRRIGKLLNVQAVLEGSIRNNSGRFRVTAQLSRVSDGYHLWSETYDRELLDVFALQDEICHSVVLALNMPPPAQTARPDPATYLLYLKGRYHLNQRTHDSIIKGLAYFEQALRRDSANALVHAALADSFSLLGMFGMAPPEEVFPKARAAAEKAVALDSRLAEAYTSLAVVKAWFDWDRAAAESAFTRAIQLDGSCSTARQWYAEYLSCLGRHDQALWQIQKALELDPLSPNLSSAKGLILFLARRYDESLQQHRQTEETAPDFPLTRHYVALAYEQKQMWPEAIFLFEKEGLTSDLAHVYAESGRRSDALRILQNMEAQSCSGAYIPAYSFAEVHIGLGDKEQALAWLDRARAERSNWLPYLNVDPRFDPLRRDSRFLALLRTAAVLD